MGRSGEYITKNDICSAGEVLMAYLGPMQLPASCCTRHEQESDDRSAHIVGVLVVLAVTHGYTVGHYLHDECLTEGWLKRR
jgi:hypothetical protein